MALKTREDRRLLHQKKGRLGGERNKGKIKSKKDHFHYVFISYAL
jgi:hypothetical protein